jgi:hypothetical protein
MLRSYLRASNLKRWLGRPYCPAFIRECKSLFDKAFGLHSDNKCSDITESALVSTPDDLRDLIKTKKVKLPAYHRANNVMYSRSSTHLGNSLVMYYPAGDLNEAPVPGCIKYIVVQPGEDPVFAVQRQLSAPDNTTDPFSIYPHFPAKVYSNSLSPTLEIVRPGCIMSHYARWAFSPELAVVLCLSRVRPNLPRIFLSLTQLFLGLTESTPRNLESRGAFCHLVY